MLPNNARSAPRDEDGVGADVVVVELAVFVEELHRAAQAVHPPSHLSNTESRTGRACIRGREEEARQGTTVRTIREVCVCVCVCVGVCACLIYIYFADRVMHVCRP